MSKAIIFFLSLTFIFSVACRPRNNEYVTVALPEPFSNFNTLTTDKSDAAAERVRSLMFNSLVKKNEKFEYVGELAKEINPSEDGKTITFVLQEGVKFHNGKEFTSADVKYTFDELFRSGGFKSSAFYDTVEGSRVKHIDALETPDAKTVVFKLNRASLQNQLLSNLVAIPIIPEGTVEQQATNPIGSGAFKFVSFNQQQNIVELAANPDFFGGAPKVQKLRIKTVSDANSMQAELQSGNVDLAPLPTNLAPDSLNSLKNIPSLQVQQFNGSNIQYLQFNTESAPLNNVKLRQAIAYAFDREKIINELLSGQATIAHSILPVESWAYNAGTKYSFDQAKAKQLLLESGYKGETLKFKLAAGQVSFSQYSQVIQNALKEIGINVEIETVEPNVMRQQVAQGQFQMNTGIWVGGNQDPIFLHDLFTTQKIPSEKTKVACCNRSRYSNPEVDKLINEAFNSTNRGEAKSLYFKAQDIISQEVPMFPLWYPANMVVANKRVGNIKIGPSGDWGFIKDITLNP